MAGSDGKSEGNDSPTAADTKSKPKRVRTGCLTCRERHLKCDEGLPNCQNCRKSSRVCKRGLKLNFIDTTVQSPPIIPPTRDWSVQFQDESRDIASEYRGGLSKYAAVETPPDNLYDFSNGIPPQAPFIPHQGLPPVQPSSTSAYTDSPHTLDGSRDSHRRSISDSGTSYTVMGNPPSTSYSNHEQPLSPSNGPRDYLNQAEETLFMQVFVEEVGLWMDSMDPHKHFSRILPFHALSEPMLLNAFLACGARHLTLVNPVYKEDKAKSYYETSTRQLLGTIHNPNRDVYVCATTAVVLNVYEIMSESALQRMNHIAGARALVKDAGWNARSNGVGAACFWLNVGMEVLSCLHFNWQVAWDPDTWGVDMDFSRQDGSEREEVWTYRIVYITAKIANFRALMPHSGEPLTQDDHVRLQNRYAEWKRLKDWCESWDRSIPRTMHPMAYLHPQQTTSKSAFPEVWLIKRTTIVARLFYHTAMCLISQICPIMTNQSDEMHEMQISHSRQICGIVAHVKDRGVASVALRSLAIAAECLVVRREQEEVLSIFEKIKKETGWRVGFLNKELKEKWGWHDEAFQQQQASGLNYQSGVPQSYGGYQSNMQAMPSAPPRRPGFANPLLMADFNSAHPPYQSYYVPPNNHAPTNHWF